MASPQVENGHLDIANELVDQFMKYHLSGNEWKVLWAVMRKTWAWHKKDDSISLTQFEKATGLSRPSITEAITKLVGKRVLVVKKEPFINVYQINKDYSSWVTSREKGTSRVFGTKLVGKSLPKLVGKKEHTKEKKEIIQKKEEYISIIDYWNNTFHRRLKVREEVLKNYVKWRDDGYSFRMIRLAVHIANAESFWWNEKSPISPEFFFRRSNNAGPCNYIQDALDKYQAVYESKIKEIEEEDEEIQTN